MRRVTTVATPLAHLVGPGKIKVINGRLAFSTGEGASVRLDGEALRAIYCYGDVGITDDAVQLVFRQDIEVAFLSAAGTQFRGRLVRMDTRHTALRIIQHRVLSNAERQREWAVRVVQAKIESQLHAARHYRRQGRPIALEEIQRLEATRQACDEATLAQLRGHEGAASALWFAMLGRVLTPAWSFTSRNRRPPRDPVNALLSLGYT